MSTQSKFIPEVDDPVIKDLLPGYIKSRHLEISQIKKLLVENNFDKIRIIGHNLAGSGSLYGLSPISELGKRLEMAALEQNIQNIQNLVDDIQNFVAGVVV